MAINFMREIKSVVKIKKFPSFVDFKPTTDLPEFSKYNLIYGWNGSGKTTFSRILRLFELQTNPNDDLANPAEFELTILPSAMAIWRLSRRYEFLIKILLKIVFFAMEDQNLYFFSEKKTRRIRRKSQKPKMNLLH